MTVRHFTTIDNVDDDGFVIDPSLVHHGAITAAKIGALAGPVDPETHLNSDYPEHELGACVIVESMEVGAAVVLDENGQFSRAFPSPDVKTALGRVDMGARRVEWLRIMSERRGE